MTCACDGMTAGECLASCIFGRARGHRPYTPLVSSGRHVRTVFGVIGRDQGRGPGNIGRLSHEHGVIVIPHANGRLKMPHAQRGPVVIGLINRRRGPRPLPIVFLRAKIVLTFNLEGIGGPHDAIQRGLHWKHPPLGVWGNMRPRHLPAHIRTRENTLSYFYSFLPFIGKFVTHPHSTNAEIHPVYPLAPPHEATT